MLNQENLKAKEPVSAVDYFKPLQEYNNLLMEYKMLEAKILDFRQRILLNGGLTDFSILQKYDEYFGIEKV